MLLSNVANIMERQFPSPLFQSAPETVELEATSVAAVAGEVWEGSVRWGPGDPGYERPAFGHPALRLIGS